MKLKPPVLLVLVLTHAAVQAATLEVTTTADSGTGSLRAQIAAAAGGDTIAITATGTITLTTGEIAVTGRNLTLTGPGADKLTITTNGTTRALRFIKAGCTLSGITFNNCKALPGDVDTGGAVAVDNFSSGGANLVTTITGCAFTNNQSGWGGAVDIFNGGLVLTNCTFTGNTCNGLAFGTAGGGGALSLGSTVASSLTNCTFSGNSQTGAAPGQPGGGAIYNYGAGSATPPPVTVEHCTFIANVDAASEAGAIKGNYTGSYHTRAHLRNCLLLNNQAPATVLRNFGGTTSAILTAAYASLGGNVTDEAGTSAPVMSPATDKTGNPALASSVAPAPAPNGGPVKTYAVTRGSPAQRAGQPSAVTTDQRGAPRHATPDAGAFELIEPELAVAVSTAPLPNAAPLDFGTTPFNQPVVRTVTLTNPQTSAFSTGPLQVAGFQIPAGFTLSGNPAPSLANGESTSFNLTLTALDPGLYGAPLTFTGNDTFQPDSATPALLNQHAIQLTGLVTDTADHWRTQVFGPTATNDGAAADQANPSGDGLPNLLKYALGLDPRMSYPPATGLLAGLDSAGCLTMAVTRNPAATDVSLAVEVSDDLGATTRWTTDGTVIDVNSPTLLQVHDRASPATASRRFMRLNLRRP